MYWQNPNIGVFLQTAVIVTPRKKLYTQALNVDRKDMERSHLQALQRKNLNNNENGTAAKKKRDKQQEKMLKAWDKKVKYNKMPEPMRKAKEKKHEKMMTDTYDDVLNGIHPINPLGDGVRVMRDGKVLSRDEVMENGTIVLI